MILSNLVAVIAMSVGIRDVPSVSIPSDLVGYNSSVPVACYCSFELPTTMSVRNMIVNVINDITITFSGNCFYDSDNYENYVVQFDRLRIDFSTYCVRTSTTTGLSVIQIDSSDYSYDDIFTRVISSNVDSELFYLNGSLVPDAISQILTLDFEFTNEYDDFYLDRGFNIPFARQLIGPMFPLLQDDDEYQRFAITFNFDSIIENAILRDSRLSFDQGYYSGYADGNKYGQSVAYQRGYDDGYNDGFSADSTAMTIFNGILNVALVPINFFLSIFNFEVLGINIKGLVSALLTIAIVIIVIRLITGKKE